MPDPINTKGEGIHPLNLSSALCKDAINVMHHVALNEHQDALEMLHAVELTAAKLRKMILETKDRRGGR